jgi:hypothetical protein
MTQKRYRVSATDEDGDVHAFETDDRDRAEQQKLLGEDLQDVEMEDRQLAEKPE